LRTLEVLCARNRIKQDFNRQKFHERPGLKRKRLATERWRKDFKQRFRGVVGRVGDLRVQGW
jgi:small subunit ribosomal protein MRP21